LQNEELHDLYSTQNIIRVNKSRKKRWAGRCSTKGWQGEKHTGFWWRTRRKDFF